MPVTAVAVWFDYACPHSYHGLRQLEEIASAMGFDIDRRPFLVRSGAIENDPSSNVLGDVPDGRLRRPLYKSGQGSGPEPASNRSVSTLAIHAATAYPKERGLDRAFYWAASKEYWEQGTDLGSLYTIRRLSVSVGLDWGEMWPKLDSGSYQNLVLARHEVASQNGVVQVPSFQIGGRLHSGTMSFEELKAAVRVP